MDSNDHELLLLLTPEHRCSYLPDRSARDRLLHPPSRIDNRIYSRFARIGFRRNGGWIYAPRCPGCRSCMSSRIAVDRFRPDRSQRRTWRTNQDLTEHVVPAEMSEEHHMLYRRYQDDRHPGGQMASMDIAACSTFLSASWSETIFIEYRLDGALLALSVVDHLDDALSCVYTVFDPGSSRRSLGTYTILRVIERAREEGRPWVYLGYWIAECDRMAYKTRFRPIELFKGGIWELQE